MKKKYMVRLSDEEREIASQVVKSLDGSPQKVRRAQILLKADRSLLYDWVIRPRDTQTGP